MAIHISSDGFGELDIPVGPVHIDELKARDPMEFEDAIISALLNSGWRPEQGKNNPTRCKVKIYVSAEAYFPGDELTEKSPYGINEFNGFVVDGKLFGFYDPLRQDPHCDTSNSRFDCIPVPRGSTRDDSFLSLAGKLTENTAFHWTDGGVVPHGSGDTFHVLYGEAREPGVPGDRHALFQNAGSGVIEYSRYTFFYPPDPDAPYKIKFVVTRNAILNGKIVFEVTDAFGTTKIRNFTACEIQAHGGAYLGETVSGNIFLVDVIASSGSLYIIPKDWTLLQYPGIKIPMVADTSKFDDSTFFSGSGGQGDLFWLILPALGEVPAAFNFHSGLLMLSNELYGVRRARLRFGEYTGGSSFPPQSSADGPWIDGSARILAPHLGSAHQVAGTDVLTESDKPIITPAYIMLDDASSEPQLVGKIPNAIVVSQAYPNNLAGEMDFLNIPWRLAATTHPSVNHNSGASLWLAKQTPTSIPPFHAILQWEYYFDWNYWDKLFFPLGRVFGGLYPYRLTILENDKILPIMPGDPQAFGWPSGSPVQRAGKFYVGLSTPLAIGSPKSTNPLGSGIELLVWGWPTCQQFDNGLEGEYAFGIQDSLGQVTGSPILLKAEFWRHESSLPALAPDNGILVRQLRGFPLEVFIGPGCGAWPILVNPTYEGDSDYGGLEDALAFLGATAEVFGDSLKISSPLANTAGKVKFGVTCYNNDPTEGKQYVTTGYYIIVIEPFFGGAADEWEGVSV